MRRIVPVLAQWLVRVSGNMTKLVARCWSRSKDDNMLYFLLGLSVPENSPRKSSNLQQQQQRLKMISQTDPREANPLTLDYIMIHLRIGAGRRDRRRHRALSNFQDLQPISETSDLVELRMDLTSCSTTCSDTKSSSCRCAPPFFLSSLAPPSQQDILVSRSPYLCKFSHRTEPSRSNDLVLAIWLPPTRQAPLMLPTPTLPRTRAPSSHI